MKAIERYFHVLLFIMLYKVVPTFKSVNEILVRDHSSEIYWAVLSCDTQSLSRAFEQNKVRENKKKKQQTSKKKNRNEIQQFLFTFFSFQSVPESFSESETYEADQAAEDDTQDKDSDVGSDAFDDIDTDILMEDDGSVPQYDMDDLSDFESQGSDSEFEGDAGDDQDVKSPLFLQLTCSLRDRNSHGQPMTPVTINTLPVCLGKGKVKGALSRGFRRFLI